MVPHIPLRRFDALTLGYFAIVATIVTLGHARVPKWYDIPLGMALGAVLVVVIVGWHAARPASRWRTMVRFGYPLAFATVVYGAVGRYATVLRGHYVDTGMNAFEQAVFGGHPNLVLGAIASRPLTEALYACYFSFYLFFLIPPLMLWHSGRDVDLERYVFALMTALYTCYLGFLIVPLAGPGTSLHGRFHPAVLTGYVMVPLQKFIQAKGDPLGACFPSAHVAGAWTALLAIRSLWGRRAFHRVLPVVVLLTVAVVYTRYHYLSDALAGLAVAAVVFPLVHRRGWRLVGTRDAGPSVAVEGALA